MARKPKPKIESEEVLEEESAEETEPIEEVKEPANEEPVLGLETRTTGPAPDEVFEQTPQEEPVIVVPELPEPTFEDEKPAEEIKAEPVKPEPLLTVTITEDFKDGAFKERFAKLGYPVLWKRGETRKIPMNLFVRCIRSGAKFEM